MVHLDQVILFAADDWLKIAGTIFFIVLYGLQHILASRNDAKRMKPKNARQPRNPPGQPPQAKPANQADPLRQEVEAFLRKAEGKKQDRSETRKESPREPVAQERRPLTSRERLRPGGRPRRPAQSTGAPRKALEAETVPVEIIELGHEDVGQHVARHLDKRHVTEGAQHLGEQVALADDRIETRLEQKFEHQVGSLQHQEEHVQESGSSVAEEIRQLLSRPQGIRQLVVANEILRRPEERW